MCDHRDSARDGDDCSSEVKAGRGRDGGWEIGAVFALFYSALQSIHWGIGAVSALCYSALQASHKGPHLSCDLTPTVRRRTGSPGKRVSHHRISPSLLPLMRWRRPNGWMCTLTTWSDPTRRMGERRLMSRGRISARGGGGGGVALQPRSMYYHPAYLPTCPPACLRLLAPARLTHDLWCA